MEAFKELQRGKCELITSAATHGFLPLLGIQKEAIYAQIAAGIEHQKIFGNTTWNCPPNAVTRVDWKTS